MIDVTVRKLIVVYYVERGNHDPAYQTGVETFEATIELHRMIRVPDAVLGAMTEIDLGGIEPDAVDRVLYIPELGFTGVYINVAPTMEQLIDVPAGSTAQYQAGKRVNALSDEHVAAGWQRAESELEDE